MRTWIKRTAIVLLLVLFVSLAAAYGLLRGSLAQLEGQRVVTGLRAAAEVQRDALGTVTVQAASRADAYRALGFVHAQERYFEMDLTRRSAAGELSALLGRSTLEVDRQRRVHRLRARARAAVAELDAPTRALLQAYREGVNAGLDALTVRPWSYILLRSTPEPWRDEDSVLTVHAMYFDLQDSANQRELALHRLRRHLPEELVDALSADGSEWDAPLMGEARPALDLGELGIGVSGSADLHSSTQVGTQLERVEPHAPGSNNFAVAGALTAHGHAIVADDMHLGLRAPNLWFRARLQFPDDTARGTAVDINGLSLPGVPGIVVGSNGRVAWGFTNSYGDWFDWIRVDWDDRAALRYRTADGVVDAQRTDERIEVRGGEPERLEVIETQWGPLLHDEPDGSSLALSWVPHHPGSVNLGLLELETAANLDAALDIANRTGMPHQNFVAGDAAGRIGWTISGRLPQRMGACDPLRPLQPLQGCGWNGWVAPDAAPRISDPTDGRLWTANSRVADGDALSLIGDGGYALGARQGQIRDWLQARQHFDEADLLALQLDDRALFLERWWQMLRRVLQQAPELAELEAATRAWDGRAAPHSVSYRLTREFRSEVTRRLLDALLAPARAVEGDDLLVPRLFQLEALVWPMAHAAEAVNDATRIDVANLLHASAQTVSDRLASQPGGLGLRTWGEFNTARIRHPLAGALPAPLAAALTMPPQGLPGDHNLPRVQGPGFGASQRMVVAPGREQYGILHMPGGQSGHPLSPYWGAGHQDWVSGNASAFLPGAAVAQLSLQPAQD